MTYTITTNEWTSPHDALPPVGREVLTRIARRLGCGCYELQWSVLKWNGIYWSYANSDTRIPHDVCVHDWYLFEKPTKYIQK